MKCEIKYEHYRYFFFPQDCNYLLRSSWIKSIIFIPNIFFIQSFIIHRLLSRRHILFCRTYLAGTKVIAQNNRLQNCGRRGTATQPLGPSRLTDWGCVPRWRVVLGLQRGSGISEGAWQCLQHLGGGVRFLRFFLPILAIVHWKPSYSRYRLAIIWRN